MLLYCVYLYATLQYTNMCITAFYTLFLFSLSLFFLGAVVVWLFLCFIHPQGGRHLWLPSSCWVDEMAIKNIQNTQSLFLFFLLFFFFFLFIVDRIPTLWFVSFSYQEFIFWFFDDRCDMWKSRTLAKNGEEEDAGDRPAGHDQMFSFSPFFGFVFSFSFLFGVIWCNATDDWSRKKENIKTR